MTDFMLNLKTKTKQHWIFYFQFEPKY